MLRKKINMLLVVGIAMSSVASVAVAVQAKEQVARGMAQAQKKEEFIDSAKKRCKRIAKGPQTFYNAWRKQNVEEVVEGVVGCCAYALGLYATYRLGAFFMGETSTQPVDTAEPADDVKPDPANPAQNDVDALVRAEEQRQAGQELIDEQAERRRQAARRQQEQQERQAEHKRQEEQELIEEQAERRRQAARRQQEGLVQEPELAAAQVIERSQQFAGIVAGIAAREEQRQAGQELIDEQAERRRQAARRQQEQQERQAEHKRQEEQELIEEQAERRRQAARRQQEGLVQEPELAAAQVIERSQQFAGIVAGIAAREEQRQQEQQYAEEEQRRAEKARHQQVCDTWLEDQRELVALVGEEERRSDSGLDHSLCQHVWHPKTSVQCFAKRFDFFRK